MYFTQIRGLQLDVLRIKKSLSGAAAEAGEVKAKFIKNRACPVCGNKGLLCWWYKYKEGKFIVDVFIHTCTNWECIFKTEVKSMRQGKPKCTICKKLNLC